MTIWILQVSNADYDDDDERAIFGTRKELFEHVRRFYPNYKQASYTWARKHLLAVINNEIEPINHWYYTKANMWSSLS